jgi:hypothetical protein
MTPFWIGLLVGLFVGAALGVLGLAMVGVSAALDQRGGRR